jgi:hypothetical protein
MLTALRRALVPMLANGVCIHPPPTTTTTATTMP